MTTVYEEITQLGSPIDVMYLMHKVYKVHTDRTEILAEKLQHGGDLNEVKANVDAWLKHLLYHADTEDTYMTGPLIANLHAHRSRPAKKNELEHEDLRIIGGEIADFIEQDDNAVLANDVASRFILKEKEEHTELARKAEDVEYALLQTLGDTKTIARNRRHLHQKIMELRGEEFDHFENEEAFVLPLVKEYMTSEQELECSRKLLFDDESENPRWIIDFIYSELEPHEQELLQQLEDSFS
jgi:hypothetical protein